jgi:7,8-dihydroneopterin aldolase/epimerase/oxygenase
MAARRVAAAALSEIEMDKIILRQLEVATVIGIWEWERRTTQIVRLDIELATDVRRAAEHDRIDDALNYRDVAKRLIEFIGGSEFQLVETLAEASARLLIREFAIPWVKLTVTKPGAISGSREVGVVIERSAEDLGD